MPHFCVTSGLEVIDQIMFSVKIVTGPTQFTWKLAQDLVPETQNQDDLVTSVNSLCWDLSSKYNAHSKGNTDQSVKTRLKLLNT